MLCSPATAGSVMDEEWRAKREAGEGIDNKGLYKAQSAGKEFKLA